MTKPDYPDTHHDVSSNTIFGFWLYLMTDAILFATLFATYAVLKTDMAVGPKPQELLSLSSAFQETLILLTSSFTIGLALLAANRKVMGSVIGWFTATFVLGALFVSMEMSECARILGAGYTWKTNAFLSSYFTIIGVHGLHMVVGLLLMILFVLQLIHRGFAATVLRRLVCLKMYWQFVYLLWIFTFIIVYINGVK